MNLCDYQRSRSFMDLGPRSLRFNIFKPLFLRNLLAKFQVDPPWDGRMKVCSNCPGHMTMAIYVKYIKKSFSLGPKGWWPWKLMCSIGYYQVCTSDDPGLTLTLTYFTARSNFVPYAIVGEEVKTIDFSETIVIYDIKVDRCSQLNEYMKLYEYQSWRSFIDLGPNLSDLIFLNFFSSITTRPIEVKFHVEPPWNGGKKACWNDSGLFSSIAADFNISSALRWAI